MDGGEVDVELAGAVPGRRRGMDPLDVLPGRGLRCALGLGGRGENHPPPPSGRPYPPADPEGGGKKVRSGRGGTFKVPGG